MNTKPLYTLTVDEFTSLIKATVLQILKDQEKENKKENEQEVYFDISELASFLHCTKATIHNYKKNGLPFYKVRRKLIFQKSVVLDFMKGIKKPKRFI
jgi:hypothetical protein